MTSPNSLVHQLINKERKRRGLPYVKWSQDLYYLAKDQSNYCARVGRLVHSARYALQGGENLCGGKGDFSPQSIVRSWMHSKAGHREWLLDPRVKEAGVGITKSRHGTYAAWAFNGDTNGFPNITLPNPIEITNRISKWLAKYKLSIKQRRKGMLRTPVSIFIGIIGLLGIVLGIHGLYVFINRLELLFGGEASKLLLMWEVPIRFRPLVEWASLQGLQSWFIPAVILVGSYLVFNSSDILGHMTRLLEKMKLW